MLASNAYKEYVCRAFFDKQNRELKKRQKCIEEQFATAETRRVEVQRRTDSTEQNYQSMLSAVKDYLGACLCAVPHLRDVDLTRLAARFLRSQGTCVCYTN